MPTRTLLIIDDEAEILDVVGYAASREGYRVVTASSVESARTVFERERPDAVILDLMLKGGNGLDFLRELRRLHRTPVVILSSKDDDADVVAGLELGADDYVRKPFTTAELVARLRAVLRRSEGTSDGSHFILRGDLRIEPERHEFFWRKQTIRLTVSEGSILTALAENPGRVHSRDALLHAIHGFDPATSERVVDAHIKEIRRKFRRADPDADPIETVPMLGYRLRNPG